MSLVRLATVDTKYQAPTKKNTWVDFALGYAQHGWAVFPVHIAVRGKCSCGKSACTSIGKHPRTNEGLYAATKDEDAIRAWGELDYSVANIGIRTGKESGLVVLDIDPDKGGEESLRQLEVEHGPLPGQRFTYCLSVEYDKIADYSLWLDFLRQVVTEDMPEVIAFLQEAVGYALTGHTKEEKLLYLYGPTRSGKGTFTETLLALLGHPLSSEVDFNTFTRDRSTDANNFDLAPLRPARLLVASESSQYEKLNEAKLKQLTGGNYVRCAFKYGTHFTYRPRSKILLVSNHEIKADPIDSALWARIVRVEFPYSYLGREDTTLKERLKSPEYLQGVLAWAVEGAIWWYQKGLRVPLVLQEHLKEVRLEQDHIQQWLDACTARDATSFVTNAILYQSYEMWCADEWYEISPGGHFGRALKQKGLEPKKKGQRGYEGLRMID